MTVTGRRKIDVEISSPYENGQSTLLAAVLHCRTSASLSGVVLPYSFSKLSTPDGLSGKHFQALYSGPRLQPRPVNGRFGGWHRGSRNGMDIDTPGTFDG